MNNNTLSLRHIVTCLSALLSTVGTLVLVGCSTEHEETPSARRINMGAVASKPMDLAELFMEGESANGDGRVQFKGAEVRLSGQQALDLLAIAELANRHRDYSTQYAAVLAAMFVATPGQRTGCWDRYASLFNELPATGAAALADLIREDIELAEKHGNGITSDASVAQQARTSRAASEYFAAEREYQQAQGNFDDDEALIMSARIRLHAAGVIAHGDSDWQFTLNIDRMLTSTRGDLWETQANAADSTFVGGRTEWNRELQWGRMRARNAIELYRRGVEPIRPNRSGE